MADRPYSVVSSQSGALAVNTPLPLDHDELEASSFREPRAPYLAESVPFMSESPRDSFMQDTPNNSGMFLAGKQEDMAAEDHPLPSDGPAPKTKRRRSTGLLVFFGLLALIIVAAAVVLPIIFVVIKPGHNKSAASTHAGGSSNPTATGSASNPKGSTTPISASTITGGDGSTITASDGSTFTYSNSFGGICEFCFICSTTTT
jgi:glucan 1,3-beta-glucosidase